MKEKLRNSPLPFLLLLLTLAFTACQEKAGELALEHPTGHSEEVEISDDLEFLLQPTNSRVVSSVSTIQTKEKTRQATVDMEGIITYDPRQIFTIPARVGGRIEKLYVKYNFQPVRKGEKLLELYSPELITAQKELLYLVQSAPEDKGLIQSAKQKLRLLGATDGQISTLLSSGQASYTFALYSPYDGYVVGLNTAAPSSAPAAGAPTASGSTGSGMGTMAGESSGGNASGASLASRPSENIQLREGMYLSPGQPLLQVVNARHLWAEFNAPAQEEAALEKGQPVRITFPQMPNDTIRAKIDFLQPFYEAGENFAKVRVYLPSQQRLAMVGQLVKARATYGTGVSLWLPQEAVLDLGTQSVAFKKVDGGFEPVVITVGLLEGNEVQVLSGLQVSDPVASNAQFLVDSESFIRINKK